MTVELHRLPNGLRIVTENMPGLKSASVGVWVSAGGRHERLEQNGIAHFLEHMAFKGTKRRTSLQIAEAIEDVGGYINAYTGRETTAYYARVLQEDVALAFDVISDIVLNPVFDLDEIEVERGVILQEIGQALDTPDDVVFDWLQDRAFADQPLGRTILGSAERVKSFQREDFMGFVNEFYGPENLIVSAAGAVDHDQIVRMAEEAFGHLTRRHHGNAAAAAFVGGEIRVQKPLEQAHFVLGLQSPGYRAPEVYAAQVHAICMGGGMSSRLFQEMREKRGLCYSVFAQAGAFSDTGLMTYYAGTSAEKLPELAELLVHELRRAADDLSEQEVARARAQLKAGMLMGLESASNRCERLARVVAIWDRVPPLEETIAQVDAVTTDRAREFAAGLCQTGQAALALYAPSDLAPGVEEIARKLAA